MTLTALDWFILVVLAGGLARGLMAGAVRQVASVAGLLVAFFVSVQFMQPVGELVVQSLGLADGVAPVIGFVTLFVGVQLVVIALSRMIEHILDSLHLTVVNRVAGGAVGGLKAALLLSVLFLVLGSVDMPASETRSESALYDPVATVLPTAWDAAAQYVPRMKEVSDQFGADLRPKLRPVSQFPYTGPDEPAPPADSTGTRDARPKERGEASSADGDGRVETDS